jgi:hypothetical protein
MDEVCCHVQVDFLELERESWTLLAPPLGSGGTLRPYQPHTVLVLRWALFTRTGANTHATYSLSLVWICFPFITLLTQRVFFCGLLW